MKVNPLCEIHLTIPVVRGEENEQKMNDANVFCGGNCDPSCFTFSELLSI